jgi:sarcosine oxidase
MENNRVDVIIVGGGVMGCAAAYWLAREGRSTRVLERFRVGNHMGSSHGATRLFRLAHASTDYVNLARIAHGLWHEVEDESGEQLIQPMDGLDIGSRGILEPFRTAMQAARVPFEVLGREEIAQRYPQFNLPEDVIGLFQNSYAILYADRTVSTLSAQAVKNGASIYEHQTVYEIRPSGDGVQVRTGTDTYRAGRLVLCAGSWMQGLVKPLGIDLPLTILKEHLTYFKPDDPWRWMPGRFPIFRQHLEGMEGRWGVGFPVQEGKGVKLLVDLTGPVVEPDDPDRSADQGVADTVRAYATRVLPTLGRNMVEVETCRYTMTPDDDFIIDHHPAYPQIVIASPCSGHGFKFAPLIGKILADLAVRGKTEYEIGRFRLEREGIRKNNTKVAKDTKEKI